VERADIGLERERRRRENFFGRVRRGGTRRRVKDGVAKVRRKKEQTRRMLSIGFNDL